MRKNIWNGKFVLFEGLDKSGKTTVMKKVAESIAHDYDFFYCKGLGPNTFLEQVTRHCPNTFLILLGLVYATYFLIVPALKNRKIVLQDRYIFTIMSHVPSVERMWNRLLVKLFSPLFFESDLILYFQVSIEERSRRLKSSSEISRSHRALINKPDLIIRREKKMRELLDSYRHKTIIIDTTDKTIEETGELVAKKIISFLERNYQKEDN